MTIVVAYADTPPGHAALKAAAEEALRRQSPIVVVGAERGHPVTIEQAAQVLGEQAVSLKAAGLALRVEESALHDPSDAVIQVAQELDAELICVGLRRRSPVGKLVLGSTAQRILLDATCPVLSVKAESSVA